jgi:hypothetical protein
VSPKKQESIESGASPASRSTTENTAQDGETAQRPSDRPLIQVLGSTLSDDQPQESSHGDRAGEKQARKPSIQVLGSTPDGDVAELSNDFESHVTVTAPRDRLDVSHVVAEACVAVERIAVAAANQQSLDTFSNGGKDTKPNRDADMYGRQICAHIAVLKHVPWELAGNADLARMVACLAFLRGKYFSGEMESMVAVS